MLDIFSGEALDAFAAAYPMVKARLTHGLAGHPLLSLKALWRAAKRIKPADLEHNAAIDLPLGIANADIPDNGLDVFDTIDRIEACGSWVLLKKVQQLPDYAELLDEAMAEVAPAVVPATGPILRPDAYVFISSAGASTPLHFDPDYNILAQIRGRKTFTLFPADDHEMAPQWFKERYFSGGTRNLPWEERFAGRGTRHHLAPGEALYVPLHAPHHVEVEPGDYSISLSLTWRSVWSHHHDDAHRLNRRLRTIGLHPPRPRPFPQGNLARSLAERVIERVERRLGLAG